MFIVTHDEPPAKALDANDVHRKLGTDAARALTDSLPDIDFGNGYDPDGPSVKAESPRPALLPVYKPFPIDETSIPPRAWAVPGFLMRRHVTVLVAPSGSGKSLLTLQLGLASAKGKSWAGWFPRGKFQVFVVNSEDDIDEMRRRLAAAVRPLMKTSRSQACSKMGSVSRQSTQAVRRRRLRPFGEVRLRVLDDGS